MDKEKIKQAVALIIEAIGEDSSREGLVETPDRIARMYEEIFAGLGKEADVHLNKTFEIVDDNMVVVKDIPFYSMCEHHFLPFYGKAHIAYIPNKRVAGLSKLARTVEVYAKRPQLQERLTMQVADAIYNYLDSRGCLVVVEAEHLCMNMRGIKKPGSMTVTSVSRGIIDDDINLKNEAFRLMGF